MVYSVGLPSPPRAIMRSISRSHSRSVSRSPSCEGSPSHYGSRRRAIPPPCEPQSRSAKSVSALRGVYEPPPYGLSHRPQPVSPLHVSRRRNAPPEVKENVTKKGSGQQVYGVDSMVNLRDVALAQARKQIDEGRERAIAQQRNKEAELVEQRRMEFEKNEMSRRNRAQAAVLAEQVARKREEREHRLVEDIAKSTHNTLNVIPERGQIDERTARRQIHTQEHCPTEFRHTPGKRMLHDHPALGTSKEYDTARSASASPRRRTYTQSAKTPFDTYEANPAYPEPAQPGERSKFCHPTRAHTNAHRHSDSRLGRKTHVLHNESRVVMAVKKGESTAPSKFSRRPPQERVVVEGGGSEGGGRRRTHSLDAKCTRPW